MPLPDFKNEDEFRKKWITPFLSKIGYILPKHVHGPDEQGKDFFFFDHDRFGNLRLYAVQAKLGNIGVGKDLADLLDQIARIFEVRLKYHQGAHDQRIAAAYLMTTGHFTPAARERIYEWCLTRQCGENIICMSGETLDNLERYATYQTDADLRNRLRALADECAYNVLAANRIIQSSSVGQPQFVYFRTMAIDDVLRRPVSHFQASHHFLVAAWEQMKVFNLYVGPTQRTFSPPQIATERQRAEGLISGLGLLVHLCSKTIASLDAQYNLSIQLLPPSPS